MVSFGFEKCCKSSAHTHTYRFATTESIISIQQVCNTCLSSMSIWPKYFYQFKIFLKLKNPNPEYTPGITVLTSSPPWNVPREVARFHNTTFWLWASLRIPMITASSKKQMAACNSRDSCCCRGQCFSRTCPRSVMTHNTNSNCFPGMQTRRHVTPYWK